nr:hypothetical protein [Candidatus Sigynarchaeota archaeon]
MPRYRTGKLTAAEKNRRNLGFAIILILLISLVITLVVFMSTFKGS